MKTIIVTMRNKETGVRFVFHETAHSTRNLSEIPRRIMKHSPELVLVKMTVKR